MSTGGDGDGRANVTQSVLKDTGAVLFGLRLRWREGRKDEMESGYDQKNAQENLMDCL